MALSSYKQYSGAYRQRMQTAFNAARAKGTIPEPYATPKPCEMCGQTHNTMLHQEEYGPTLADYLDSSHWLCGRCHTMLHLRFRFPGRWAAYKQACRLGPQPAIPHMGVLFGEARGWRDIPVTAGTAEGNSWWEALTCDRFTGHILP